jgi:hypothetical protein
VILSSAKVTTTIMPIENTFAIVQDNVPSTASAVLVRMTGFETARIGKEWIQPEALEEGQLVDEIRYFGRHSIRPGNTLSLYQAGKEMPVEVIDIRRVHPAQLTQALIEELGFSSLEEYVHATGRSLPEQAWYLTFASASEDQSQAPAEAKILDEIMTAQEVAEVFSLNESTVRVNIHRGNLPARKSAGIWLIRRIDAENRWRHAR